MGRTSNPIVAVSRLIIVAAIAGLVYFTSITAIKAVEEAFHNQQFPEALAIKVEELPLIFPLHMVTGGLALFLVPLALVLGLRRAAFHKLAGRVAAADVLIAGVTAIPVAYVMPVTLVSAAGFIAQALVWLGLLAAGIWNIRSGRVQAHQTCMLLLAAVTSGAMFFRVYLGLWAIYGSRKYFKVFYAVDAWIAWSLPLIAMAIGIYIVRRFKRYRPVPSHSG